jgi:putative ABC transport system substrate-binding protein
MVPSGPAIADGEAALEEPRKLGVLFWHDSPNDEDALKGIRSALEETGRKFDLEVARADSDPEKAKALLDAFVSDPKELIFAMGTEAALLAAKHVKEIPIVFTAVTNPKESGVVTSWEGSGTNVAGNSNWIASETLLHVFRLAVPGLSRMGILRSTTSGKVSNAELRSMRQYLRRPDAPKVEIIEEVVEDKDGIKPAVERMKKAGIQTIWIPIDYDIYHNMDRVLQAVEPHAIPLVSSSLKGIRAGALTGVVVDYALLGKQAVVIALDILERGADPGKMPIGVMHGYQVVVNLGAARRCHYQVPLSLLALADAIMEDVDH